MGRSAGPGSPLSFRCAKARGLEQVLEQALGQQARPHRVTRTGRTRRHRTERGSVLGLRSLSADHEYQCSCGHVGWTNHSDVLKALYG